MHLRDNEIFKMSVNIQSSKAKPLHAVIKAEHSRVTLLCKYDPVIDIAVLQGPFPYNPRAVVAVCTQRHSTDTRRGFSSFRNVDLSSHLTQLMRHSPFMFQ